MEQVGAAVASPLGGSYNGVGSGSRCGTERRTRRVLKPLANGDLLRCLILQLAYQLQSALLSDTVMYWQRAQPRQCLVHAVHAMLQLTSWCGLRPKEPKSSRAQSLDSPSTVAPQKPSAQLVRTGCAGERLMFIAYVLKLPGSRFSAPNSHLANHEQSKNRRETEMNAQRGHPVHRCVHERKAAAWLRVSAGDSGHDPLSPAMQSPSPTVVVSQ